MQTKTLAAGPTVGPSRAFSGTSRRPVWMCASHIHTHLGDVFTEMQAACSGAPVQGAVTAREHAHAAPQQQHHHYFHPQPHLQPQQQPQQQHHSQQQHGSTHLLHNESCHVTSRSDGAAVLSQLRQGVLGPRGIQLAIVEASGSALLEAVLVMQLLQEDLAAEAGSDMLVLFQPCLGDVATGGRTGAHALLLTKAKCPTWLCRSPTTYFHVSSSSLGEAGASQLVAQVTSTVLEQGSVRVQCGPGPTVLACAFALLKAARKAVKATGNTDLLCCSRIEVSGPDADGRESATVSFDLFKQRAPQKSHAAAGAAATQEAAHASSRRH